MARSFLIMLIIPVTNADSAERAARSIGTDMYRLSRKVSPPSCPVAIRICAIIKNRKKQMIKIRDRLPSFVLGRNFMIYLGNRG